MPSLMQYLPGYYRKSKVIQSVTGVEGSELTLFADAIQATLNQFFPDSVDTSLARWENELGIGTTANKPVDQRRTVITSKMRGVGTVNIAMLKAVAESFDYGVVNVTEQPSQYQFTVAFVDVMGIPPNLDDFQAAIEAIKPAHLAVVYEFTYCTYADLVATGKTYADVTGLALTYDQLKVYKPV